MTIVCVGIWLLLSEIFPTCLRGMFMGSAIFAMWIANFLIFALIGIFVIKCIPETRNRSLEQIEHYLHDWLSDEVETPPLPAPGRKAEIH